MKLILEPMFGSDFSWSIRKEYSSSRSNIFSVGEVYQMKEYINKRFPFAKWLWVMVMRYHSILIIPKILIILNFLSRIGG